MEVCWQFGSGHLLIMVASAGDCVRWRWERRERTLCFDKSDLVKNIRNEKKKKINFTCLVYKLDEN